MQHSQGRYDDIYSDDVIMHMPVMYMATIWMAMRYITARKACRILLYTNYVRPTATVVYFIHQIRATTCSCVE